VDSDGPNEACITWGRPLADTIEASADYFDDLFYVLIVLIMVTLSRLRGRVCWRSAAESGDKFWLQHPSR